MTRFAFLGISLDVDFIYFALFSNRGYGLPWNTGKVRFLSNLCMTFPLSKTFLRIVKELCYPEKECEVKTGDIHKGQQFTKTWQPSSKSEPVGIQVYQWKHTLFLDFENAF